MPRSRLLTQNERAALKPTGGFVKQVLTHISSKVSVSWAWYDKANGVVQWTFTNDDTVPHSVVLLRNGYYFGGAFWPVYEANSNGRGASATNPADNFGVDWAKDLSPMPDKGILNNAPPLAIVDFFPHPRTVNFVFTVAPGSSWTMLEGGFSASMTPSGISLYEVTAENTGQFCVGYDPQRVSDWDAQTGTNFQGYSPNPSTFDTVEVQVEADAPFDVLPFTDSIADGPCAGPAPSPSDCSQYLSKLAADIEAGNEEAAIGDLESLILCLFASGFLKDLEKASSRIKAAVEKRL